MKIHYWWDFWLVDSLIMILYYQIRLNMLINTNHKKTSTNKEHSIGSTHYLLYFQNHFLKRKGAIRNRQWRIVSKCEVNAPRNLKVYCRNNIGSPLVSDIFINSFLPVGHNRVAANKSIKLHRFAGCKSISPYSQART